MLVTNRATAALPTVPMGACHTIRPRGPDSNASANPQSPDMPYQGELNGLFNK